MSSIHSSWMPFRRVQQLVVRRVTITKPLTSTCVKQNWPSTGTSVTARQQRTRSGSCCYCCAVDYHQAHVRVAKDYHQPFPVLRMEGWVTVWCVMFTLITVGKSLNSKGIGGCLMIEAISCTHHTPQTNILACWWDLACCFPHKSLSWACCVGVLSLGEEASPVVLQHEGSFSNAEEQLPQQRPRLE